LCTALSSGPGAPTPPFECAWKDSLTDNATYATVEECSSAANAMLGDEEGLKKLFAAVQLTYGAPAQNYYIYCESQVTLKDFYKKFYVDTSEMGEYS